MAKKPKTVKQFAAAIKKLKKEVKGLEKAKHGVAKVNKKKLAKKKKAVKKKKAKKRGKKRRKKKR